MLRVCWIGDRQRLLREAAVGRALPIEGSATRRSWRWGDLLVDGVAITWMTSRRLSGTTLLKVWGSSASGSVTRPCVTS